MSILRTTAFAAFLMGVAIFVLAGAFILFFWVTARPEPRELSLPAIVLFGGDFAFGLNYQDQERARGKGHILEQRGYEAPLAGLRPLLDRADFTVLNLETVLTTRRRVLFEDKAYIHYDDPVRSARTLKSIGVDAVSLANNHALDFGAEGLSEMSAKLRTSGIALFGAGVNNRGAGRAYIFELPVNGHRVSLALIGAFEFRRNYDEKFRFYAGADRPGVAVLDPESIRREIGRVRVDRPGAIIVVFPHWGQNYVWRSKAQKRAGRALIDAGADIVIGHGAHAFQEIEFYEDKLILYGIGNFMFNSTGRYRWASTPPYSLAAELRLGARAGNFRGDMRLYPIASDNLKTDYRPRPVTAIEFAWSLLNLAFKSWGTVFGGEMKMGEDDIGRFVEFRNVIQRPIGAQD